MTLQVEFGGDDSITLTDETMRCVLWCQDSAKSLSGRAGAGYTWPLSTLPSCLVRRTLVDPTLDQIIEVTNEQLGRLVESHGLRTGVDKVRRAQERGSLH